MDPTAADNDDEDDDDASQHQPKKKKTRGSGILYDWCELALQALGAYGDFETGEGLANAVGHGKIWDMVESMQKHRLNDPAEAARLQRDEPTAYKIIDRERRSGGVSQHLKIMVEKQGRVQMLHRFDPKNVHDVNLYLIKRNSAMDAPGQASSSASEAGTSSNAAASAPASTLHSTADHVSDDIWHASEQAAEDEAFAVDVERRLPKRKRVVKTTKVTYYQDDDSDDESDAFTTSVMEQDSHKRRKELTRAAGKAPAPARSHPKRKREAPWRLTSTTLRGPSTQKYAESRPVDYRTLGNDEDSDDGYRSPENDSNSGQWSPASSAKTSDSVPDESDSGDASAVEEESDSDSSSFD